MTELADSSETVKPLRVPTAPWPVRALLIALGSFFVAVGMIGIFLPLLPTTVFFLIAAACYARGSQRAHRWLTTNRFFGRYLRHYQEEHGATLGTKIVTLTSLWGGLALAAYVVTPPLWGYAILATIGLGVTMHLLRLRTLRA